MHESRTPDASRHERRDAAAVLAFLDRYTQDRDQGIVRTLRDYQALFPAFAEVVAREYELLTEPCDLPAPAIGAKARLRVLERLASGGMGTVFRVWDDDLGRELAMKMARDGDAAGARTTARFLDEARITGRLQHPGVVPVHRIGVDEHGRVFFTMALIRGSSLEAVIDKVARGSDGWSLVRAVDVLAQVCDAVAFAHSRGVVHRDLKPSNVMVGEFGETYVMDWGLAKTADGAADAGGEDLMADRAAVTVAGDVLGTPPYMAPEQAQAEAAGIGPQVDVYAIGGILYHLLSGRMPYGEEGADTTSRAVLARLREGPPRLLAEVAGAAPPELVAICDRAMARDPADRYASVVELRDDLRAFRELRVVRAYRTGAVAELSKWVSRNRVAAACAAVAAAATVIGLVVALVEGSRADAAAARARANADMAYAAVDALLTDVAMGDLKDVPGAAVARGRLLQRALEFERRFVVAADGDPEARARLAAAHYRSGYLCSELGDPAGAEAGYREAVRILTELIERDPRRELLVKRASVRADLGLLLKNAGEFAPALAELEPAARTMQELLDAGADAELANDLCSAMNGIGTVLHEQGRFEQALEWRHRATALARQLAAQAPSADASATAGLMAANEGNTLLGLRRPEQAAARFADAVAHLEQAAAKKPKGRSVLNWLAAAYNSSSFAQQELGDDDRSRGLLAKAVAIRRTLFEEFPSYPELASELAGNLHNLGNALVRGGRPGEALPLFVEAETLQRQVLARQPRSMRARSYLSYHLSSLCGACLAVGDHERAAASAARLGPSPAGGVPPHLAASYTARCLDVLAADDTLTASQREAARERYLQQAIELVRGAVAAGLSDRALLDGPEFAPLHQRPEFAAIVAELDR